MDFPTLLPPERYIVELECLYESIEAHDYTDRYSKTTDMTIAICSRLKYFYIFHYRELTVDETMSLFNLLAIYYNRLPLYDNDNPDEYLYNKHDIACQRRATFSSVGLGYIDWRYQLDIRGLYPIRTKQYIALKRELVRKLSWYKSGITYEGFANDIRRRMEIADRLHINATNHPLNMLYEKAHKYDVYTADQWDTFSDGVKEYKTILVTPDELDNRTEWIGIASPDKARDLLNGTYKESDEEHKLYDVISADNVDAFAKYIVEKWVPIWDRWEKHPYDRYDCPQRDETNVLESIGDLINEKCAIEITKWAINNGYKELYNYIHPINGISIYPEIYDIIVDVPVDDLHEKYQEDERYTDSFHSMAIVDREYQRSHKPPTDEQSCDSKEAPFDTIHDFLALLSYVREGYLKPLKSFNFGKLHIELKQLSTGPYKNLKEFYTCRDENRLKYLISSPETIIRNNCTKQLALMNSSIALYVHYILSQNGVFEGLSFDKIFSRYQLHERRSEERYERLKAEKQYSHMCLGKIWKIAYEFSDD